MLEPIRMVADWMAHGLNGPSGQLDGVGSVNALLPGVPLDGADPAPPAVTTYDSTHHGWLARLSRPPEGVNLTFPALAVFLPEDIEFSGEVKPTVFRDGVVSVAVMYLTENPDSAPALAASLYTARAVMRAFSKLNHPDQEAFRVRNGVQLRYCEKLRTVRGGVTQDGLVLSNGILATYHLRDTAP